MSKILYLAGRMSGIPDYNAPEFVAKAAALRAAGYRVISPKEIDDHLCIDYSWPVTPDQRRALLDADKAYVKYFAEGVATLEGWEDSEGACEEVGVAMELDKPVKCWSVWVHEAEAVIADATPADVERVEQNILEEAVALTRGSRNADYGHPYDDWSRTAAMASAMFGFPVTATQCILFMILVKVSRACNREKRDNWVDIAGYGDCGQRIAEMIKRLDEKEVT